MQRSDIVFGTCQGTGAAIYVALGFIPRFVEVWNLEDAGSLLPRAQWHRQMALVAAMDEGVVETGISDTDYDRTVMATGGISPYSGGDEIIYDGVTNNRWEDLSGNDVTEKFVDGHYERSAAADAAFKCIGNVLAPNPSNGQKVKVPAGFIIGTNANLNVDDEQLCFMAIR